MSELLRGAPAELYEEFAREVAAVPVVVGRSPISATLSGAAASYTVEAMAGKGRALQVRGRACAARMLLALPVVTKLCWPTRCRASAAAVPAPS